MNAPLPSEQDPAAIEAAMLALARAAAETGCRSPNAPPIVRNPAPKSDLGWVLVDPVPMALMVAEMSLRNHLIRLAGIKEASAAVNRINAALFEEFDRPALQSTSKQ